jgi:hypothetical protein
MELFLFIFLVLAVFAGLSLTFGADSRLGIGDDHARSLTASWV